MDNRVLRPGVVVVTAPTTLFGETDKANELTTLLTACRQARQSVIIDCQRLETTNLEARGLIVQLTEQFAHDGLALILVGLTKRQQQAFAVNRLTESLRLADELGAADRQLAEQP
ncbi:MAG: hypothetical protein HY975_00525 [Candidatus Kerfeldbacteria bacterium]|nr:hypothetical protein [Candidatus Kerfeldbacteria bacterium]